MKNFRLDIFLDSNLPNHIIGPSHFSDSVLVGLSVGRKVLLIPFGGRFQ
jgi:hypothetical protein